MDPFKKLRLEIMQHKDNQTFTEKGHMPLFSASSSAKIIIIGQAPGVRAQTNARPWSDASGDRLVRWLGISEEQFRSSDIAHMPMDFYYPGKGKTGDLPPRKEFADLWHPRILENLPNVELTLLIGGYSQQHYLSGKKPATLTETVRNYEMYLPDYFPLVHPSPLNFRWHKQNSWFENEVVPKLQQRVKSILH